MSMTYKLSEIMPPAFFELHRRIRAGEVTEALCEGGRGGAKSSFISEEIELQMMRHPDTHAVVLRRKENTLRRTVYNQYIWAAGALGVGSKWKATVSPMELTYLPTGQKIMFFGLDDPGNLKSIKLPFGYVAYVHFEELDQFRGPEEVRNVEQSLLRGGPIAITFKSFNPPASAANWANQYARESKPGQVKHHSTYLETPPEWLGPRFIADAEHLKALRPMAYRNEYLGEVTGGGANVFENIQLRAITDEEARELLATCKRGVFAVNGDDGYPYAIPVNYFFDAEHDKIYFHGAKAGHKVDALKRDDKICFTVYGNEWYQDGDWAPYVMSTVIFGRCRLANDAPAFIEDKVRQLALKYYPSAEEVEEEIAKDIKGVQLYEITIEHLCGKQIQEK